jgi:undecaprenyl-phosphate 4-deoxy-4-formamido-L-arabinose transferase
MPTQTLSIVIPAYNSERTIGELVDRLLAVVPGIATSYEVLIVNDGSVDGTWSAIESMTAAHANVRGIDLVRNHGQHNALLCGIRAARHDVIVTMDDDLQNQPEDIPRLLEALYAGADVVYGTPQQQQWSIARNIASTVTKMVLQNVMGARTARMVSGFRAFHRDARDAFAGYTARYVNIDVLLTWGAARFVALPVQHAPRRFGASNYTVRRLIRHTLDMMTGFSTYPLKLATAIGFLFTAFGVGVLAWVLSRYAIYGVVAQGFTFLASIIAIFSGAQLFALGIIGEYLARMFSRSMGQPSYTVRRQTF